MSAAETPILSSDNPELGAAPRVTLRNFFPRAFDSAIAAARTCYSSRLITPDEVTEKQRIGIGPATFNGGHHTVYQHAHFEFGLENVSRQFIWNFLHAHPFYNSEQQSQRYVRLDRAQAFVPPLEGEARTVYVQAIERAWGHYRALSAKLIPRTRETLYQVWKIGPQTDERRRKRIEAQVDKKAIEVARYVLPLAAHATLVHTVSGIVLHRMWRMSRSGDTPYETSRIVEQMVARVREVEPEFFERIGSGPLDDENLPESRLAASANPRRAREEFDAQLGGKISRLMLVDPQAECVAAQAFRAVLGISERDMDDAAALDELLNPARNRYRLETMNVSMHSPMMRALDHVHYTFQKRISHTADSQDQRHRMVPGSRPLLAATDCPEPDYLTPMLIRGNAEAEPLYQQAMEEAWAAKNRLIALGVPKQFAVYLLPNATAVRFIESGSLLHLLHKWTMRTCFNAQEEIYFASMEEIEQARAAHPRLMRYVGPPCVVRKGNAYPVCTEGSHFCGVKVWENFPNAVRLL